mmetsp:Transcript_5402/g.11912  ORF Transcript_5402/g.11912 Transcript_5402/m.11912 type:complete len:315 (-) Transcript_5402:243-1187(-)
MFSSRTRTIHTGYAHPTSHPSKINTPLTNSTCCSWCQATCEPRATHATQHTCMHNTHRMATQCNATYTCTPLLQAASDHHTNSTTRQADHPSYANQLTHSSVDASRSICMLLCPPDVQGLWGKINPTPCIQPSRSLLHRQAPMPPLLKATLHEPQVVDIPTTLDQLVGGLEGAAFTAECPLRVIDAPGVLVRAQVDPGLQGATNGAHEEQLLVLAHCRSHILHVVRVTLCCLHGKAGHGNLLDVVPHTVACHKAVQGQAHRARCMALLKVALNAHVHERPALRLKLQGLLWADPLQTLLLQLHVNHRPHSVRSS